MDLLRFLRNEITQSDIDTFVNDPRAQFRVVLPDNFVQNYLFAEVLPLVNSENTFKDEGFAWISVIGVDGSALSRIPIRSSAKSGAVLYELGANDAGGQLSPGDYASLVRLVAQNNLEGGQGIISQLLTAFVVKPLNDVIEKQRAQAIVDGQVVRIGDNGYTETIEYANPVGHRVSVGQDWYDPDYDIMEDLQEAAEAMGTVTHFLMRRSKLALFTKNYSIKERAGLNTRGANGEIVASGRATLERVNDVMQEDGLPPIRIYEGFYYDIKGNRRPFLRDSAVVLLNSSNVDPDEVPQDPDLLRPTTMGYVGNGIPAGRTANGRVARLRYNDETKAPNVEAEGTQMTLPVLRNSEENQRIKVFNIPPQA